MTRTKQIIRRSGQRSVIALGAIFAVYAVSQIVWLARDDSLLVNTDARHHFALLRTAVDRVSTGGIAVLPNAVANASLGGRAPFTRSSPHRSSRVSGGARMQPFS